MPVRKKRRVKRNPLGVELLSASVAAGSSTMPNAFSATAGTGTGGTSLLQARASSAALHPRPVGKVGASEQQQSQAITTGAQHSIRVKPVSAATGHSSEDLTEPEQRELRAAVLAELRRAICGEMEEAVVLADFICVLIDQRKSRADMASELAFFHDAAEPFAAWVEERKGELLARRLTAGGATTKRGGGRRSAAGGDGSSLSRQRRREVAAAAQQQQQQQQQQQPALRAALSPNHATAALEAQDVTVIQPSPRPTGRIPSNATAPGSFVVVTDKLVLQPNPVVVTQAGSTDANDRKMQLLSEMTKRLQEILERLADKSLDEKGRERYQAMAQSLQEKLHALSRPTRPPAPVPAPTAAAAAGGGASSPPLSP